MNQLIVFILLALATIFGFRSLIMLFAKKNFHQKIKRSYWSMWLALMMLSVAGGFISGNLLDAVFLVCISTSALAVAYFLQVGVYKLFINKINKK